MNTQITETHGLSIATEESARGGFVKTTGTIREMKLFGIYENELETISLMNGVSGIFASLGTGLLAFAGGQLIDLAKSETAGQTPAFVCTVCWICGVAAAVCYLISGWAFWKRHSQIKRIKTQSKTILQ